MKITARQFMGHAEFTTPLAPVTWLWGRNGVGKTARAKALQIACTGGMPGAEPGKLMQPSELLRQFGSGPGMSVAVEFDNGNVRQQVWRDGKYTTNKSAVLFPSSMFAASELLSLSGPKQLQALFAALPPAAGFGDVETVRLDAIVAVKQTIVEPHTKAAEAEIAAIIEEIDGMLEAGTVQDFLSWLVTATKEGARAATAHAVAMKKTAGGATFLRATDGPTLADAIQARNVAAEALRVAEAERTTLAQQWKQAKADLDKAKATASSYQPPEPGAREKLEQRIAELRALMAKPLPELAAEPDRRNLDAAIKAVTETHVINGKLREKRVHIGRAQADADSTVRELTESECCPTCKATGTKWKKKILAEAKATTKELAAQLAEINKDITVSDKVLMLADANERQAAVAYHEATMKRSESIAAQQFKGRERVQLQTCIDNAQRQLSDINEAAQKQAPALAAAALVPDMEQRLEGLETAGEQVQTRAGVLRHESFAADKVLATAQTEAGAAATAAKAAEAADAAEQAAKVRKAVAAKVAEMQAECVEGAIKPFLARANSLCAGFMASPIEYRDGSLGRVMGNKFIELGAESYGGTERTLARAAICVALSAGQPCRIAVIDEVGNLNRENRQRLVDTLCLLVKDNNIDAALLLGPDEPDVALSYNEPLFAAVHITK